MTLADDSQECRLFWRNLLISFLLLLTLVAGTVALSLGTRRPAVIVKDFGSINSSAGVVDSRPPLLGVDNIIRFNPSQTVVANPQTNNASKFHVLDPGAPDYAVVYTPVFPEASIVGTASAQLELSANLPNPIFYYGVAWTIDNITLNSLAEAQYTGAGGAGINDVAISFAASFTPAQLVSSGGNVELVSYFRLDPTVLGAFYSISAVAIKVTEV